MAIQFLNNLNINDNQLLNVKVQVASSAPTAAKGQIYLDSTSNVNTLKYHDGSAWIGLKQLNLNNSTFINLADGSVTGSNVISLTASLNATGTPDSTKYLRGDNTWSAISGIYVWTVSDGSGTVSVLNTDTVTIQGTTDEVTASLNTSAKVLTIGLPNDVTLQGGLTVLGTGQSSFGGQVTVPETPASNTDAASKGYVDSAIAGGVIYQGGYNAATNTPNLDTPPTVTVLKGFMWTVTADGLFFGEQVRVGDSLIANVNSPTTLAGWTTVQGNIDLATLSTVGIGNVNAGSGVSIGYSAGTATVTNTDKGSSQNIFKNIAVSGQSTVVADGNDDTLTLVAGSNVTITTDASTDTITISTAAATTSYATTISTSSTVTHGLGTLDVMIQLYDTVTSETVYADVTRPSINTVTITFSVAPTNPIRVLVQK